MLALVAIVIVLGCVRAQDSCWANRAQSAQMLDAAVEKLKHLGYRVDYGNITFENVRYEVLCCAVNS
jgi:hypothetical protein